ncbi:MAG: glycosyltransferase family 4 protein, partial [Thermoanaerobaculia bacterium]
IDWPRIEAFTGPLDVFHSIQGRLPAARRARLLLTLHDFRHYRLPHLYPGIRWFPREIARADHFTAASEATRRHAVEFLEIPPERITTVYWGPPEPPPPLAPERRGAALARRGIGSPYIFCPSSSDPRKNVAGAIRAHQILRQRTGCPHGLVVVGELPPGAEASLRRSAGDRVVFTGGVPDEEYFALLESAALSVQPSLDEGFGFPVLEAFQAGVPLAVARGSSLPEVAGPAALTFDPREPEDMAQALERLIAEPGLPGRLVALGRERLGEFSWERTARQLLDLYRRREARRPRLCDALRWRAVAGGSGGESRTSRA